MTERLLEWLSYRGNGRPSDLPSELLSDGSAGHVLADLSILGHLEREEDRWRIAPPVLAVLGDGSEEAAAAILCGARTRGLVARLKTACESRGADLKTIVQPGRPDCILVTAATTLDLCSIASDASLNWQRDAAFTLLASLPRISEWPREPIPMVAGRTQSVRRFSRSRLRWIDTTLDEAQAAAQGLFEIKRDWDTVIVLKEGANSQSRIEKAAGRLIVAAKTKKLHIDLNSSSLFLPASLRPPTLVTRALVLCSGRLPEFVQNTRQIVFRGVAGRAARLAAAILGLRLA
ncbi:hypothetical protein GWG67_35905 [Bradyrhizobium sp. CSS354]|nr:hypothetical protein [Bradyrhizobium sp. CSS354]